MRKTLTIVLCLTLVSLLSLSGVALAGGKGGRGGSGFVGSGFASIQVGNPGYVNTLIRFSGEIGLDSDQVQKLTSIATEFEKEAATVTADIRVAEVELRELLAKKDVSMADVEAKIKGINSLGSGLRLAMTKAQIEARNLLSDEQLAKFESLKGERSLRRNRRS